MTLLQGRRGSGGASVLSHHLGKRLIDRLESV